MSSKMMIAVVALLALGAGVALAACGSDDNDEAVSGQFALVDGAPDGYGDLSGEATLQRSDGGTEASIELSGLEPDAEYVAHVHAAGCDQPDPGGPHYKFDPNGSDMPPNEIHFSFTSNAEGEGEAEASNDQRIPDEDAGSIVVHSAEADGGHGGEMEGGEAMRHEGDGHGHSDKIACAELEGGTAPEAASPEEDGAMEHEGETMQNEDSAVPTIAIRNGQPVGGVEELEYDAGERVRFRVRSNEVDEVHVHGYDIHADVAPGSPATLSFPADIEGIFEVELHESGELIAELQVNP